MFDNQVTADVRKLSEGVSVIDVTGEVTASAEGALMAAYNQVSEDGAQAILFNFEEMTYMNSSGIGLLVTILIRAQRQGQKLMAYGLKPHFRKVFELTRLSEAITIYEDEDTAMAAVGEE